MLINDNNADSSKYKYSASNLNERINIAQLDVVKKTKCLEGREYITVSSASYTYTISTMTIETVRAGFQNSSSTTTFQVLVKVTQADMDLIKDWETKPAGNPQQFFMRKNTLNLYPKPSGTYAGYLVRHDYIKIPATLSSDGSIPFDGELYLEPYHPLIIWYVVALCRADVSGDLASDQYYKKYLEEITLIIKDPGMMR